MLSCMRDVRSIEQGAVVFYTVLQYNVKYYQEYIQGAGAVLPIYFSTVCMQQAACSH